jgi:ketosteroid isomerase-like protein
MYGGGSPGPVLELLAPAIAWHVPGSSPIAGDHQGKDAVAAYFQLRRTLAEATMRMTPGDAIVTDDCVAQFVRGEATLGGEEVSWQTVGAYRFEGELVAEVSLVPLDLKLFDRIWSQP